MLEAALSSQCSSAPTALQPSCSAPMKPPWRVPWLKTFPDVIIASYEGYFMQGMWPPIRLEDPKILKRAYTDALDLPEKKILALQHATLSHTSA